MFRLQNRIISMLSFAKLSSVWISNSGPGNSIHFALFLFCRLWKRRSTRNPPIRRANTDSSLQTSLSRIQTSLYSSVLQLISSDVCLSAPTVWRTVSDAFKSMKSTDLQNLGFYLQYHERMTVRLLVGHCGNATDTLHGEAERTKKKKKKKRKQNKTKQKTAPVLLMSTKFHEVPLPQQTTASSFSTVLVIVSCYCRSVYRREILSFCHKIVFVSSTAVRENFTEMPVHISTKQFCVLPIHNKTVVLRNGTAC